MTKPLPPSTFYLQSFLINFKDGLDPVSDLDGSILALKQARLRLGSFISQSGSIQELIMQMGITDTCPNAQLRTMLARIREYRDKAQAQAHPQAQAYWNLMAEIMTMIHGYLREDVLS